MPIGISYSRLPETGEIGAGKLVNFGAMRHSGATSLDGLPRNELNRRGDGITA